MKILRRLFLPYFLAFYRNLSNSRSAFSIFLTLGARIRFPRPMTRSIWRRAFRSSRGFALALGIQHTAGDHQLNKIGLILRDLPHQSRRPLRRGSLIGQRPGHVAPGHGHGHVARQNAGAHGLAGEDFIPQAGIHRLNAAYGAQGGHTGKQLRFGIARADLKGNGPEEGVTETLKVSDQMEWVGRMNSCRGRVSETVYYQVIYT